MTPYARLDTGEADQLANAVGDIAELYGIPAMSPEVMAWTNLIQTVGFIYGTRFMAWRADVRRKATERGEPASAENSKGSTTPHANAPKAEPIQPVNPPMMQTYVEGFGMVEVPAAP